MQSQVLFIGLMLAVFWFLIIRPQQQRAKQQRSMIDALKPGDHIVTIGGLYAKIVSVGDRLRISVADGTELELAPQAVAKVVVEPVPDAEAGASDDA